MKKIVFKTTIGFVSLGLITGAGILATNYIKHDGQLTYTSEIAQKSSSLKDIEQEIKKAEEDLGKAEVVKEEAENEVKKAEETISEASKEKEAAIAELKNAKTEEEKEIAQAKIDETTKKIEQAEETKKVAEKKVEEATKTVEQNKQVVEEKVAEKKEAEKKIEEATKPAEQNKQNVEEKIEEEKGTENEIVSNKTAESNVTATNNKTQSNAKNNTTTKQKDESEEQGSKFDLSKYPDLLDEINKKTEEQVKEIEEEAKKKTVEFHFYSANKELMLRCRGEHCGEGQQGYIWFVELECDLNKCEGFTDSTTGNKVSKVLLGRRGDITNYTVIAPAAKYGYKFVGWELVSTRKIATNELGTGALLGKYIATYEKI